MAAGERRRRADSGMVALLQALSETKEDEEGARLLGLSRVADGTLFAATWPTAPDTVRTLTNSDGEQAMPLFSGLDTLEAAARRFGWLNPDGSLSMREMPAREAMQSAVAQNVHFIVLDIHAEYSTEFTRDEVARVLREARPMRAARKPERPGPALDAPTKESLRPTPSRSSGRPRSPSGRLAAAAMKSAQGGIAEIDLPFKERGTGPVAAPPPAAAPSDSARGRATGKRDPRVDSEPAAAPRAAGIHARHETKKAMPVAHPSRTAPLQPRPVQEEPRATAAAPARARVGTAKGFRAVDPPTEPLPFVAAIPVEREPSPMPFAAARVEPPPPPAAPVIDALPALDALPLDNLAGALPSLPTLESESLVSLPPIPSAPPVGLPAPPEPAARKDPAHAAPKPGATKTAAGPKPAASPESSREKRGAPAAAAEVVEAEAVAEGATAGALSLRTPANPLDSAVLEAISNALRRFPEVEWASEVADENDAPVIGVRVDPSFGKRLAEIEAAVRAAGESVGATFSILMLRDLQAMKDARSAGGTFFPWRKRGPGKR